MPKAIRNWAVIAACLLISGCTVHPDGERQERQAAMRSGKAFEGGFAGHDAPPLPDNPTTDDLVQRALHVNPELQQRYWEWRSAIEQIPQDGTQSTNLALFAGLSITNGSTRLGDATLSAGNDPMADIVLPPKLAIAAQRALENARAAGLRFRKAQFTLRAKVLNAVADYAMTAQLIPLEQSNAELLATTLSVVDAKNRAGAAGQQDILSARSELDLSRSNIATLEAQLPAQRATINAQLDRPVTAPLPLTTQIPMPSTLAADDATVLDLAARRNPELEALGHEIAARRDSIRLAKLQYLPDISLTGGSDLTGVAQSLAGMITVPVFRYEAISAATAQAEANLRAMDAMRRNSSNDLAVQVVTALNGIRNADRQLRLLQDTVLPRATQAVSLTRSRYETGQASLLDLLNTQRSLLGIRRLVVDLRVSGAKQLADLEAVTAAPLPTQ